MIKPALLALWMAVTPVLAEDGPLRVGTVDMQRIFKGYHRTQAAEKEYHVELARIQKQESERLSGIRDIEAQLEKLAKQLEDPTLAESKKAKLYQQATDRREEGIALERERRDFVERVRRQINERMLQVMNGLLTEIRNSMRSPGRRTTIMFSMYPASAPCRFRSFSPLRKVAI